MHPSTARTTAEVIALYERAAAVLSASAALAEGEAKRAEEGGEPARAALDRSHGERARYAAGQGRRRARRLRLRAQADRLFGDPPNWRALFEGGDAVGDSRLQSLEEAVIGTDLAGTVKLWNEAAERLYGWSAADVVGRPITEITVGPEDAEIAERIMASVRLVGSWEGEFWVTRGDRSRFLAYVRDVVVPDDEGRPLGLVGISIHLASGLADPFPATRARALRP